MRAASVVKRGLLSLCVLLLLVQTALASHGIEHAFHHDDEACIECLALPGLAALPSRPSPLPLVVNWPALQNCTVPPASTFWEPHPYLSRGPPTFQS